MKRLLAYIAVAALTLGLFAWWYYQPERVLARHLDDLLETVAFSPSTTRTSRVVKSASLEKFFDSQVELTTPHDEATGNFSPEDIRHGYSYLSENAREISIKRDAKIQTKIDGDHATQEFEADVKIDISRWLKGPSGRSHITLHWRKTEAGWRIHSAHASPMP